MSTAGSRSRRGSSRVCGVCWVISSQTRSTTWIGVGGRPHDSPNPCHLPAKAPLIAASRPERHHPRSALHSPRARLVTGAPTPSVPQSHRNSLCPRVAAPPRFEPSTLRAFAKPHEGGRDRRGSGPMSAGATAGPRPPPRPELAAIPRLAQLFESPWGRKESPHSRR